ncbi:phenylalanine--tRNA ligase subunit beta [Parasphaerochaeta coccoides]|uniref:phenylalanine--tRNA ligase n=1 Tax=Parasphaerochaeta coccoides (strain ATCC BAA-1237 / DSM 17374 / SPN1) TaxID=760011 RepID=F4GM21_PARC1|nr:phenylalanine--tRNA ligase subunit beta [Parasphaerochaeta coccoides]AEC02496.1 phenylalanyl-tRNA synthetase beta subunit [Parasphaerochaeta coccoides DSM 17374]
MPKIETSGKLLFSLMGRTYADEQLEKYFPVAKAELDGHDEANDLYKIELNDTNRPDLWSAPGLARQLRQYVSGDNPVLYDFFSTSEVSMDDGGRKLVIDESARRVRPYSVGFAATGVTVDEDILQALIQSQEKLCWNFGRKRRSIAMGVYRNDIITYPVHYRGADPDATSFVALGMEEKHTLREICTLHPKGKEYGYIVKDAPVYPFLHDDRNEPLSFPPVINSARIGAVKTGDKELFFEFSGTGLEDILLAASIIACDLADMGYAILPVTAVYPYDTPFGREITVPYYFQEPVACPLETVHAILGQKLTGEQSVQALKNMGVFSVFEKDCLYVTVPEYRNDFLHPVDVAEDVMIGRGLENFAPEMPDDFTVGRISPAEVLGRKVQELMVGMGFQEMIYNYLGSRREYIDNMHVCGKDAIFIANPMSENYEVVRPSILPSLLESESVSGHAVYPHRIFEVGKVAYKEPSENSGVVTRNHLGFLSADNDAGFNDALAYVKTLMYFLGKDYALAELAEDSRFLAGRCARVMVEGREVGVFGEIHPAVLESWGTTMPTIGAEFDLDRLG